MAYILHHTHDNITRASDYLRAGGIVAFPTETIYGLGANAHDDKAVAKIYATKNRPAKNPLICHLPEDDYQIWLDKIIDWQSCHHRYAYDILSQEFWSSASTIGALTLILPLKTNHSIAHNVLAGLSTIAVRVPKHHIAQALIKQSQTIIAAPSANPSGRLSPTYARHVAQMFADNDNLWLIDDDSQQQKYGLESTIIDLSDHDINILRAGAIPHQNIAQHIAINSKNMPSTIKTNIKAPGMAFRHYAPLYPLRINIEKPNPNEAYLGFGKYDYDDGRPYLNLSPTGDLNEAATHLFDYLFTLEEKIQQNNQYNAIAVAPIPHRDIGMAINDRLQKASEA